MSSAVAQRGPSASRDPQSNAAQRGRRLAHWWEALHAEWTKVRTLPGTFWLVAGLAVLTYAVDAAATAGTRCTAADCGQDPGKVALTGVELGQAVAAILGVLAVAGEYSTGMVKVTFAALPRRTSVLAAKAAIVSGLTLVAGAVAMLATVPTAQQLMPGRGFTAAHGYAAFSLGDGAVLRAAGGSVLYLGLIALLGLGLATLIRDSAASVGVVLGVLYLSPIIASVVTDPRWHDRIERYSPMSAGLAVESTRDLASMPIGPWEGLGVLALWAAGSLIAGAAVLHRRDA